MAAGTRVESMPEDCLSHVLSFASPTDACRSSAVSAAFRDAADSDLVWENFLPSDYPEIISRSVSPVEFSSKKDLFRRLSFPEIVELVMVCWLEIHGRIDISMLSPNTSYGAYLIIQLLDRAFGLDTVLCEVSIEIGDHRMQRPIHLTRDKCRGEGSGVSRKGEEDVVRTRGDGWLEVELGEFYNNGREKEVKMWFRETKGVHLKGGLLVEGIELRPIE
ncbi:F-box protein PP2-B15 [Sesamum alatum]|uniref:F-box protein PP2-B15 n=1 Tax=Sesamum alatum TaxID=300844 RepID=A0AAE1Y6H5_9LAMI|nr:F-box protein PP2-B15 [Sesamum alatum]